jgi:dUTP pyrophosphatase
MTHAAALLIVNKSRHPLPAYETAHSAGLDLRAHLAQSLDIQPLQRVMVPTGLFIQLPEGHEAQVRPRSGLAWKQGITVLNAPGTIDADYRGEVKVILINLSDTPVTLHDGDRIAQLVVTAYSRMAVTEVSSLEESVRGAGGFGSTGLR